MSNAPQTVTKNCARCGFNIGTNPVSHLCPACCVAEIAETQERMAGYPGMPIREIHELEQSAAMCREWSVKIKESMIEKGFPG